ncbi:uncharacterized protein FOMMEDRAFT_145743 [Fomitiporia mediterranea MF3/22]|uniref:uncharacterized protein n=1 Tax=Fomitiporia mediterranea (strain MF3/22) TaxID=694068 RepID=UPI0004407C89|nr:uncharacterized protein FOMMEDRAFT_145743 [Fomitiporia mediterranea MF3/22]EJD05160.1 hypothetical protein FOMMEDRAFT_145743 [Fomitiporia mediterranea MF3/22]
MLQWYIDGEEPAYLHSPFKCCKVVVRQEYRELLAWIWSYFGGGDGGEQSGYKPDPNINKASLFPPHNPFKGLNVVSVRHELNDGVVVTGTPGIGKSLFLLFVLALRLLAKQTTVFHCFAGEFLIFDETGVYISKDMASELRFLPEHTWFLVDSNQSVTSPPVTFLYSCTLYSRKIVVAASPRKQRFDWTSKYTRIIPVWCDIFTFEEILKARDAQIGKELVSELELQSFWNNYGGIARNAFSLYDRPDKYERKIEQNLRGIHWETLEDTIKELSSGYFDTQFSHNTIVARPEKDTRDDFYCEFAAPRIAEIIVGYYAQKSHFKAVQLYRYFLQTPKTRASAGYLLESTVFTNLQSGSGWKNWKEW